MTLAPPIVSNDFAKLIDWVDKERGNGGFTVWDIMQHFAARRETLRDYFHQSVHLFNKNPYCPILYADWSLLVEAGAIKLKKVEPPLIHYAVNAKRFRLFQVRSQPSQ